MIAPKQTKPKLTPKEKFDLRQKRRQNSPIAKMKAARARNLKEKELREIAARKAKEKAQAQVAAPTVAERVEALQPGEFINVGVETGP